MAEIGLAILGKISEYLVEPIGRQLGYLVQFSGNVETLKNELERLRNLEVDVQQKVHVARNNVETILNEVETWLKDVGKAEGEAQTIIDDKARFPKGCLNGWFLNIKSRHALSRKAKKRTQDIIDLQQEAKFPKVSLPAPPKFFIGSTSTAFDSRELKLKEIINNLKDENISMIGICGMGGVGKTTMVEEVLKRAKEENMFDDYAKTVVSQTVNIMKIQRDIAEWLSLTLEESDLNLRAGRLNHRLEGKKVLIIMDDVWEEFHLKTLGITLEGGQKKCKIIFTSRNRDHLWTEFGSRRHELSLDPLPNNESWNLFKENVGDFPDETLVEECGGLPLAVVALGCALRRRQKHTWNDTRERLRTTEGMGGLKGLESLRLSYDYLDNDEAKSLFLLCSLFEEDSRIYIESLVGIGMGLRLFIRNSVDKARDRVFALVELLQSRCLVSKGKDFITVHDVLRDVSKSIASTEKGSLVLEHGVTLEMLPGQTLPKHCTWISVISDRITEFPSQLQFPSLELLRCKNKGIQIQDRCFEGMVKLQVLDIICSIEPSYFRSLQF